MTDAVASSVHVVVVGAGLAGLRNLHTFREQGLEEWRWSERYATQPETLRYINHVADRFDLRKDVHLGQRMTDARWDERASRWEVVTESGGRWSARFLIMVGDALPGGGVVRQRRRDPGQARCLHAVPGGVRGYRRILEQIVADGYEGFELRGALERTQALVAPV